MTNPYIPFIVGCGIVIIYMLISFRQPVRKSKFPLSILFVVGIAMCCGWFALIANQIPIRNLGKPDAVYDVNMHNNKYAEELENSVSVYTNIGNIVIYKSDLEVIKSGKKKLEKYITKDKTIYRLYILPQQVELLENSKLKFLE